MPRMLLTLLFALQISLPSSACPEPVHIMYSPVQEQPQICRLWWGMLDPELSAWFARLPMEEDRHEPAVLWDWSWRGFLASLFQQPMPKEDFANALTL